MQADDHVEVDKRPVLVEAEEGLAMPDKRSEGLVLAEGRVEGNIATATSHIGIGLDLLLPRLDVAGVRRHHPLSFRIRSHFSRASLACTKIVSI